MRIRPHEDTAVSVALSDQHPRRAVRLTDLMNGARYERDGSDLASRRLYVDLPSWGYHVFAVDVV
jgi:hypothetical protein